MNLTPTFKMKNIVFFCLLIFSNFVFSQFRPHKTNPKIEKARIEFLKNELKLDSNTSQKFWPLFKNHTQKMQQLFDARKKTHKGLVIDRLNNNEADILLNKLDNQELKIEKEKKKFQDKIRTILTSKQVLKLRVSEHHFRRKLLKRMKKKQN